MKLLLRFVIDELVNRFLPCLRTHLIKRDSINEFIYTNIPCVINLVPFTTSITRINCFHNHIENLVQRKASKYSVGVCSRGANGNKYE
jgi:hypothetical protein